MNELLEISGQLWVNGIGKASHWFIIYISTSEHYLQIALYIVEPDFGSFISSWNRLVM